MNRAGAGGWGLGANNGCPRSGISLLEVLISMFVLMIGLLGVASLLPVGQVQVVEGIKQDRAGAVGRAAFRDIKVRKMLNPGTWAYADGTRYFGNIDSDPEEGIILTVPPPIGGQTDESWLPACIIDPIGIGDGTPTIRPTMLTFPAAKSSPAMVVPAKDLALPRLSYWWKYPTPLPAGFVPPPWKDMLGPERWLMGDAHFRCTDDVLSERPKSGDLPATQTFSPSTSTNPKRQFTGDYTWIMTVVPETLKSEMPSPPPTVLLPEMGRAPSQEWHDLWKVSVVVFYKRDMTGNTDPSTGLNYYTGERAYAVDFDRGLGVGTGLGLSGGEVILRNVDEKDPLRSGQWIMLAGQYYDARDVLPPTPPGTLGKVRRKYGWYRVASTTRPTKNANGTFDMAVSLVGPDWQANEATIPANNRPLRGCTPPLGTAGAVDANTQAWLFDGAIAVFEKTMRLDWE